MQEAVYLVMPELWLQKTFRKMIFLNSNVPEKRYKIFRRKNNLDELPDDSTDAFQRNMFDHYLDRLDGEFRMVYLQQMIHNVLQSFYPFVISSQSQN